MEFHVGAAQHAGSFISNSPVSTAPVSSVPEPASLALLLPGLGAVALLKRRKQNGSPSGSG